MINPATYLRQRLETIDPRLITILLIAFVQMVGASMAMPILPLFARREFAMEPGVITLLVSSFFAAQFIAGPYIGRLSDIYGRVPVLIISQIGTVISFIMIGAAQGPIMLLVSRILDGITGGNIIVVQAYMTDISPRERRTHSLGLVMAAIGVGIIFGPALGGVLSALVGMRAPFYMAAVAAALTTLLTWSTLNETLTPEQRAHNRAATRAKLGPGEVIANRPLLLILLVMFLGQFGFGLLISTFSLFGEQVLFEGFDKQTADLGIGLLLAVFGFGQLGTQILLLQRLLNRFNESILAVLGLLVRAVGLVMIAVALSPWPVVPGMILFAVGNGIVTPALQTLATDTVVDEVRGGALGWLQSSRNLAVIISTAIAGIVFEIAPAMPYWIGAFMMLAAALPAFVLYRWQQRINVRSEAEAVAAMD